MPPAFLVASALASVLLAGAPAASTATAQADRARARRALLERGQEGPRAQDGAPAEDAADAEGEAPAPEWTPLTPEEVTASSPDTIERHFEVCDLDANGWISYREASAVLGVTPPEFRRFDRDGDGRFDHDEFAREHARMRQLLGASPSPEPGGAAARRERRRAAEQDALDVVPGNPWREVLGGGTADEPDEGEDVALELRSALAEPYPDAAELLALFDRDGSGGLTRAEVERALRRVRAPLSADVIVDRTDRDRSEELEREELAPLASMVARRWRRPPPSPPAGGTDEGDPTGRAQRIDSGFDHFSRLDADGDGRIDADDLRRRLVPVRSSVRGRAVLSALDLDGDGAVDEGEFRRAFQGG